MNSPALSGAMSVRFVIEKTQIAPMRNALIFPTGHAADFLNGQPGSAQSPSEDGIYRSPVKLERCQLA